MPQWCVRDVHENRPHKHIHTHPHSHTRLLFRQKESELSAPAFAIAPTTLPRLACQSACTHRSFAAAARSNYIHQAAAWWPGAIFYRLLRTASAAPAGGGGTELFSGRPTCARLYRIVLLILRLLCACVCVCCTIWMNGNNWVHLFGCLRECGRTCCIHNGHAFELRKIVQLIVGRCGCRILREIIAESEHTHTVHHKPEHLNNCRKIHANDRANVHSICVCGFR